MGTSTKREINHHKTDFSANAEINFIDFPWFRRHRWCQEPSLCCPKAQFIMIKNNFISKRIFVNESFCKNSIQATLCLPVSLHKYSNARRLTRQDGRTLPNLKE